MSQPADMIEHTGLSVSNFVKAKKFYLKALTPLGYEIIYDMKKEQAIGLGTRKSNGDPETSFWIHKGAAQRPHMHVAFRAKTRKAVKEFYEAALKAGGKDNGGPGVREDYAPNYYAAFVLDPDGNNIEAVSYRK